MNIDHTLETTYSVNIFKISKIEAVEQTIMDYDDHDHDNDYKVMLKDGTTHIYRSSCAITFPVIDGEPHLRIS